jgi:hypothetical protein
VCSDLQLDYVDLFLVDLIAMMAGYGELSWCWTGEGNWCEQLVHQKA